MKSICSSIYFQCLAAVPTNTTESVCLWEATEGSHAYCMPFSLPPIQQQQKQRKYLRPTYCYITFPLQKKLDIVHLGHPSCAQCIRMPLGQTLTHSLQGIAWGLNNCNHSKSMVNNTICRYRDKQNWFSFKNENVVVCVLTQCNIHHNHSPYIDCFSMKILQHAMCYPCHPYNESCGSCL